MSGLKNFKIYVFLSVICFIGIQSVKADYYKEYSVCDSYENGDYIVAEKSASDESGLWLVSRKNIGTYKEEYEYVSEVVNDGRYPNESGELVYVSKCYYKKYFLANGIGKGTTSISDETGSYQIPYEYRGTNENPQYDYIISRVLSCFNSEELKELYIGNMTCIGNESTDIKRIIVNSIECQRDCNIKYMLDENGKIDYNLTSEFRRNCYSRCYGNFTPHSLVDKEYIKEFQSTDGYVTDSSMCGSKSNDVIKTCGIKDVKHITKTKIIDPSEISLSEGTIELQKGETFDIKRILTVKYTKENSVTYTSSNPDKISVSSDGIITVNEVDSAKITIASANNNGISAVLNVETSPLPGDEDEEPEIIPDPITENILITNGDSITLPYDYDFTIISGESFVKKINKNTFQGIKAGTATVQYTTSSKQVITYNINVQKATTYAQGDLIILKKDKTYDFSSINSLGELTWSSSDNNIAKVDSNGKVTGISSGIVTIMAKKEYYEYTNKVYVYESNVKKENIENAPSVDAEIGAKISIGLGSDYKWISSDPSIASIDNNGDITLLKEGTTIILGQKDDKYYAKEINVYTKKEDSTSDGTKGDGLSTDKVLDKNAEFRIENVLEDHKDYSKISNMFKKANKIKVYDIGYYLEDKKIQPNGEVIVELDIPQDFDANNIAVFRVEDNGTLTKLISKVVGNKIQVSTNHFSYYIVAEVNEPTAYEIVKEASNNGIIENPQTGTIISIIVIIIGAMIALGIYLSTKAKNKFIRL